jgi:hypothetical protein
MTYKINWPINLTLKLGFRLAEAPFPMNYVSRTFVSLKDFREPPAARWGSGPKKGFDPATIGFITLNKQFCITIKLRFGALTEWLSCKPRTCYSNSSDSLCLRARRFESCRRRFFASFELVSIVLAVFLLLQRNFHVA